MITRNTFLKTSAATFAAVLPGARAAFAAARAPAVRRLRLGVVSDIHVATADGKDRAAFAKALARFRDLRVDGVLLPGDMANNGRIEQLQIVADAWYEAFPNDRLPSGEKVEKLFVYGNHDSSRLPYGIGAGNLKGAVKRWGSEEEAKKHLIAYNERAAWRQCFHEDWAPIYAKTVKGYVFIGCHWGYERDLAAWLKEHAARLGLRGSKPFFYAQHPHPMGTVNSAHGGFAWGHDGGAATPALSAFPNAVAFSGHSHYALTDDQSIWQGAFTSVNAGSTSYPGWRNGRDNGEWDNHGRHGRKIGPVPVAKRLSADARHAMVLDVYDDRLVFARHDLACDLSLGPDWVCPLPACTSAAARPYAFEASEARARVPFFPAANAAPPHARASTPAANTATPQARTSAPAEAKETPVGAIDVTARKGRDRSGKACDIVAVSFPSARSDGPLGRLNEYEITVENTAYGFTRIAAQKRVVARDSAFPLPKETDGREECLFRLDELPQETPLVFRVAPLNSFGRAGAPLVSTRIKLPLE